MILIVYGPLKAEVSVGEGLITLCRPPPSIGSDPIAADGLDSAPNATENGVARVPLTWRVECTINRK